MKESIIKKLLLLLITVNTVIAVNAQCTFSQLGIDIDGEANSDASGYSVSLSADGSTVAIGAILNSGGGTYRGHVRVYKNISGTWTQHGADIDGEADNDQSGWAVSISANGSIVAIGASYNAGGGLFRGHVRVYEYISGTWTQIGADLDGDVDNDQFGTSVSLSADGSTVAIGAHNAGVNRGQTKVFKNISGTWIQQGITIDGESSNDYSGHSVALSSNGSIVAIGGRNNPGGGSFRGHVMVFELISGTWTQIGADIDGESNSDVSGWAISLSSDGNTVAIGAPTNPGGGSYRGHVRIYKNISGTWTQQGADIDGESNSDESGRSVALSADGSTVAIGSYFNAGGGSGRGHVRVYKNISGTWSQQGADIDGEANSDQSGGSVSLSADGSIVAIGASVNAGGGTGRGHVRVFSLNCSNPEINVKGNNVSIVDGDITPSTADSTNFGTVASGTKRRFRIVNSGTSALTISSIAVSGTNAADFTVSGAPTSIAAGDSARFTVTFTTSSTVARNATITVNSNDADEAAYDFSITGTAVSTCGPAGRITATTTAPWSKDYLVLKKITLPNCTLDSLGISVSSAVLSKVFLYSNNAGSPDQLLTQTASSSLISGSNVLNVSNISLNAGDYWIGAIGQTNITFNSTANPLTIAYIGWPYATALPATAPLNSSFLNKELDIWPIICNGAPEINIKGNNVSIVDGDITPSTADSTNFGTVASGTKRRFSIINSGTSALTISSIAVSGTNAADFTVSGAPTSIAAGDSARFTVTFTTSSTGARNATITVNNNDADEAAYDFSITGTAVSTCGPVGRITATTTALWSKDYLILKKITLPNCTLDSLGISVSSAVLSKVFLYSNNAGSPDQLLTQTASSSLISGKNVLDVSNISITAGDYWIGAIGQTNIPFNSTANALTIAYIAWPYATALPSTAPINSSIPNRELDIWPIICTVSSPCNLTSAIPTAAGTYNSTQTAAVGSYTCYCDVDGKLLLALDTNGTRALISKDSVQLQIGSASPTVWSNAGGIITNVNGGVIFNRKWDVKPTTQPISPAKVKFFFTPAEYDSVRIKLGTLGTTITSPSNLQMYKLFSNGFGDPHAAGATGVILTNGTIPSVSIWKYAAQGTNHSAEFLVTSFSGGGGGAGAGAAPLPVNFINFTAKGINQTTAQLNWQTAQEIDNSHFNVERSTDGVTFSKIGVVNASGNSTGNYQFLDNTISKGTQYAFYRIKQIDQKGESTSTNIQLVRLNASQNNISLYPNPVSNSLTIDMPALADGEIAQITISNSVGKAVYSGTLSTQISEIDLNQLNAGVYFVLISTNSNKSTFKIIKQ